MLVTLRPAQSQKLILLTFIFKIKTKKFCSWSFPASYALCATITRPAPLRHMFHLRSMSDVSEGGAWRVVLGQTLTGTGTGTGTGHVRREGLRGLPRSSGGHQDRWKKLIAARLNSAGQKILLLNILQLHEQLG